MKLLLDTHAFLWFVLNDRRLSKRAKQAIAAPENNVYIGPASYWEIAIKIGIGKYALNEPYQSFFEDQLASNGFHILAIEPRHTAPLTNLPFHHRDPFDRLLIAQAMVEQIPIVSNDPVMDQYEVERIW